MSRTRRKSKKKKNNHNKRKGMTNKKNDAFFKKDVESLTVTKQTQQYVQPHEKNTTDFEKSKEMINSTIKWTEIGSGLGGFATTATVVAALCSFWILFMFEMNLKRYKLKIVNMQIAPSILMSGVLVFGIAFCVNLVSFVIYRTTKSRVLKVLILILTYIGILIYTLLWQTYYSYNAIDSNIIVGLLGKGMELVWLIIFCLICGVVWCVVWSGVAENQIKTASVTFYGSRILVLSLLFMIVIMNNQVEQNSDYFKTIHVPQSEIVKACGGDILCSDDGKQIWAIICETADYYYIEPIATKNLMNTEKGYSINTDYSMAIEKTNVVVHAETVKEAYQHSIKASQ